MTDEKAKAWKLVGLGRLAASTEPACSTDPLPDPAVHDIIRYSVALQTFRQDYFIEGFSEWIDVIRQVRARINNDPFMSGKEPMHPETAEALKMFERTEEIVKAKRMEQASYRSRQFRAACDSGELTPLIYNAANNQICAVVGSPSSWRRLGLDNDDFIRDDFVHPFDPISPGPFAGFGDTLHRVFFRAKQFREWRAAKTGTARPVSTIEQDTSGKPTLRSLHIKTILEGSNPVELKKIGPADLIRKHKTRFRADRVAAGLVDDGRWDGNSASYKEVERARFDILRQFRVDPRMSD